MTQLKVQLRDAAEREAHRGRLRKAAAGARANGRRPLLGVLALAAIAVVVVLIEGQLGRTKPAPPAKPPALEVVKRVGLTSNGGLLAAGFGAVWVSDAIRGEVLRVTPDGRVTARIHTGGQPMEITAGAGAVWTYEDQSGRLLRIDPATARVTARLKLDLQPQLSARGFTLTTLDGRLWAGDAWHMLRIDPTGRRIARRVAIDEHGIDAPSVTTDGHNFIVLYTNGTVQTYDGRTGARRSVTRPQAQMSYLAGGERYVIVELDTGGPDFRFIAVDRQKGRPVWQRRVTATVVDQKLVSGRTLWVLGSGASKGETLWRIDARTGRVLGTLTLQDPGATGLAAVGNRLWVMTPEGRMVIVSAR